MHARIDQLLSALDREPVDATVHAHIEQCASCTAQTRQLARTTEQLRALPQLDAPKQAWEQIAAQLAVPPVANPRWRYPAAFAGLAAGVIAVLLVVGRWGAPQLDQVAARSPQDSASQPFTNPSQQAPAAQDVKLDGAYSLPQLVEQSRQLEEVLGYLPQRPRVESVGMAATVDTIEQRVQWLDLRLSDARDARLNDEQMRSLWRERVTLMDSLVKLRYADSGWASY